MSEIAFRYAGKSYRLEPDASGRMKVYRSTQKGLVEIHGVRAFEVVSAYRRKALGETVAKRPRIYAKRPKPFYRPRKVR